MDKTSMGFHTMTIVRKLTTREAARIILIFDEYIKRTGEMEMFYIGKKKVSDEADEFTKWLYSSFQRYYIIHYPNQKKGILWLLRYSNISPGFIKPGDVDTPCSLKATINPKILTGKNDYLAASTAKYLEDVEALFNAETEKISPLLGKYSHYSMSRPDYCVNFALNELGRPCTSEQMIYLIKQGDIPRHYSERTVFSESSRRFKADSDSFYLECNSATINCYRKQKQLHEKFSDCPALEASGDLIRFEIQPKYPKTYALVKSIKTKPDISNSDVIRVMLSDDYCADLIRDYFNRVIRKGDYFTLDGAIKEVKQYRFLPKKETRLINELRRINQFRGIHKVKDTLQGDELKVFWRTLRDLSEINVNPVTIPRSWKIPRIPNLLTAYERSIEEKLADRYVEYMKNGCIDPEQEVFDKCNVSPVTLDCGMI